MQLGDFHIDTLDTQLVGYQNYVSREFQLLTSDPFPLSQKPGQAPDHVKVMLTRSFRLLNYKPRLKID